MTPNKTHGYLAEIAQKISRENKEKFPTPDSVSDYRIAKELGISLSRMSSYRTGRTQFDDEMCVKVAQYLGITEALVLFDVWQDKTKSTEVKKVLKESAKIIKVDFQNRAKAAAKALLVPILGMGALMGMPAKSEAYATFFGSHNGHSIHYAKLMVLLGQALSRLRRHPRLAACHTIPAV